MERQSRDRNVYWNARALSRLGCDQDGKRILTLILDSMDHSKWMIPRSKIFGSKAFSGMVRPCMGCTGLLAHGHLVMVAFSEGHIVKGANWTIELLSIALQKLATVIDLREYSLHIQGDNCSKELKSNSICRYLALLTSRHRVRNARLMCCASGHSHEDIDQFFSLLGAFLEVQTELRTPNQFLNALCQYLANASVRPLESMRDVRKIDVVRAWYTGCNARVLAMC